MTRTDCESCCVLETEKFENHEKSNYCYRPYHPRNEVKTNLWKGGGMTSQEAKLKHTIMCFLMFCLLTSLPTCSFFVLIFTLILFEVHLPNWTKRERDAKMVHGYWLPWRTSSLTTPKSSVTLMSTKGGEFLRFRNSILSELSDFCCIGFCVVRRPSVSVVCIL